MKRLHLVLAIALLPVAAAAGAQETDGRALIDENCLYCHDDSYIRSLNLPREEWEGVLDMMIGMGMPPLEPETQEKILDYLEEEHGPKDSSPSPGAGAPADAETNDLPWAFPRYRANPLFWRER